MLDNNLSDSRYHPDITFGGGIINIKGRSISEKSPAFFEKLINAFFEYTHNPEKSTKINILLEYVNSSSNRSLMNLLIIAEKMQERGHDVEVNWYYQKGDELMFDQGSIFRSLLDVRFNLIEK